MEYPKNREFDENKKPLKEGLTGAYVLSCADTTEWNMSGNPNATVLEGGTVRFRTTEELYTENIPNLKASLKSQAMAYSLYNVDAYFAGLIDGAPVEATKCLAVQAWLDTLWGYYYTLKVKIEIMEPYEIDFEQFGEEPYSYAECKAELDSQ
tara:strand:- start:41 stop:496 length:456 start_codon:yes stop_codon:yes gene_type:complete